MLPPHQVPSWISATAHLAHMSASVEKRSPPPQRSPTPPPPPPADPDTPLNLSKPKSSSSGSTGSSPHSVPVSMQNSIEQPVAATAPKLLPPNLLMPRAFLPYAGLPPQFSPLPPNSERMKQGKESLVGQDKHPQFPMHMYGLPAPQMGGKPREDVGKEDADFMAACHCEYQIFPLHKPCLNAQEMGECKLNLRSNEHTPSSND